jgi:hypothetical protein
MWDEQTTGREGKYNGEKETIHSEYGGKLEGQRQQKQRLAREKAGVIQEFEEMKNLMEDDAVGGASDVVTFICFI